MKSQTSQMIQSVRPEIQMKKIKPRTELHGLLLVDKPTGMTSHDVVSRIRRLAETKEVGHTGTLDPLASGLMVVLLGEATKLSSIVTEGDKAYEVQVQLGIETDTLDITGQILRQNPVSVDQDQVVRCASSLIGEIQLPIPLYSAKKIDGLKLYEYARNNVDIEIPLKQMNFGNIQYHAHPELELEHKYTFSIYCSKGSFIRSWVKKLGEQLGCGATMSALRRTQSHDYHIDESHSLIEMMDFKQQALEQSIDYNFLKYLKPIHSAIAGVKTIVVSGHDEVLLSNGQISHDLRSRLIIIFNPHKDQWVFAVKKSTHQVLAIIGLEQDIGFKIKRVFKYTSF